MSDVANNYLFSELRLTNNPGVLIGDLPPNLFASLKANVDQAVEKRISTAHTLVGMIEELYTIELDGQINNYITMMVEDYQRRFQYYVGRKPNFRRPWVNMQKKHEYSPVHNHPDMLGWVIWVNVPYDINDEINMPNSAQSKVKKNSTFEFIYPNLGGSMQTHNIPVSKSHEGMIMMFPSFLRHVVYPFYTSDDYRISVAGNVQMVA